MGKIRQIAAAALVSLAAHGVTAQTLEKMQQ